MLIKPIFKKVLVNFVVLFGVTQCYTIENEKFNENIREYEATENINTTQVKTLQKANHLPRHGNVVPEPNPVLFQDSDSEIASSGYSRGFRSEPGFAPLHYEEGTYPGYPYENPGLVGPPHGHIEPHDYHHGFGHGFHHVPHHSGHHLKHYDHTLAIKALLLPIVGVALLGAAAAVVSNPILLQLGVVSGRKRRDTEEVIGPEIDNLDIDKFESTKILHGRDDYLKTKNKDMERFRFLHELRTNTVNDEIPWNNRAYKIIKMLRRKTKQDGLFSKPQSSIDSNDDNLTNEERLVPVPLIIHRK